MINRIVGKLDVNPVFVAIQDGLVYHCSIKEEGGDFLIMCPRNVYEDMVFHIEEACSAVKVSYGSFSSVNIVLEN